MSAGQTTSNGVPTVCRVVDERRCGPVGRWPFYWAVVNGIGQPLDYFRTEESAQYAAAELNSGAARVDSHAIVGCKVVAS